MTDTPEYDMALLSCLDTFFSQGQWYKLKKPIFITPHKKVRVLNLSKDSKVVTLNMKTLTDAAEKEKELRWIQEQRRLIKERNEAVAMFIPATGPVIV